LLLTYYRLFWHVIRDNYHTIIIILKFCRLEKRFLYLFKVTGSSFRSLSNILDCDSFEFGCCFRTNRTRNSWKFVKGLRLMKFKLHYLSWSYKKIYRTIDVTLFALLRCSNTTFCNMIKTSMSKYFDNVYAELEPNSRRKTY